MNVCNSINAETLLQEGINYSKNINLLDKALTVLLKAREIDPNLPSLNFTLGRILKDNGQYYKSYAFFKHELEISKNKLNPEVLAFLYHQLILHLLKQSLELKLFQLFCQSNSNHIPSLLHLDQLN